MIRDGSLVAVEAVEPLRAIGALGARTMASSITSLYKPKDEVNRGLDASFKLEELVFNQRKGDAPMSPTDDEAPSSAASANSTMSSHLVGQP